MLADQPQVLSALHGIRAHPAQVAGVIIVGPTPDEEAELIAQLPLGITHVTVSPSTLASARAKLPGYIELEFFHAPPAGTALAKAFLHAIAQADLTRALALAESAGSTLDLVDDAIASVAARLRTGQAPKEAVAAIRALWEVRYRLAVTDVPDSAALPALVAEIANVVADLDKAAPPPPEPSRQVDADEARAILDRSFGPTHS